VPGLKIKREIYWGGFYNGEVGNTEKVLLSLIAASVLLPLLEADRRSALIFELSSILNGLDRYINRENNAKDSGILGDLPSNLKGRIIALSRSLKPYYYLDESYPETTKGNTSAKKDRQKLIKKPLSPERAQLLISLIFSGVNLQSIQDADFSSADLQGAKLAKANLQNIRLVGANLKDANLVAAKLGDAILKNVNLRGADLIDADLEFADLTGADLSEARLKDAKLQGAHLNDANLTNASFEGATLANAKLRNADLTGASLSRADLTDADLKYADLRKAVVSLHQIKKADNWEHATYDADMRRKLGLRKQGSLENGSLSSSESPVE
jgi:uncharacterized protein YjbI with pentapeptide repeats